MSPLAAMRSAPTMTASTQPFLMTLAAMLSVMSAEGTPATRSSQAVRRPPCLTGRVSSTHTCSILPCSCAVKMTPSAVPKYAVASEPALQCVSTFESSPSSSAPCAPMLAVALLVLGDHVERLLQHELAQLARGQVGVVVRDARMRSAPQNRFTAVGRVRHDLGDDLVEAGEVVVDVVDLGALGLAPQRDRERGGHTERGRAAHGERLDGDADAVVGVADEHVAQERQAGLVDQEDGR